MKTHLVRFDGDVALWIEQDSSIHLKAVNPSNDPVELTSIEARRLAQALEDLADKLDNIDDGAET